MALIISADKFTAIFVTGHFHLGIFRIPKRKFYNYLENWSTLISIILQSQKVKLLDHLWPKEYLFTISNFSERLAVVIVLCHMPYKCLHNQCGES